MELAEAIKELSKQQSEGTYPTAIMFGTITGVKPVVLKIDNQIYGSGFVVVPERLTNYKVSVDVDDSTVKLDGSTMTIHNALKVGDKVIVARQNGGQKFVILDRIGD